MPALADVERQRLLAIDVLAGFHGGDRDQRMPMIGHDNRDGVDIGPADEVAEIDVGVAAFGPALASLFGVMLVDPSLGSLPPEDLVRPIVAAPGPIHITHREHPDVVVNQE